MMASFRNSLPGIKRWQESLIEQCRRDTFVTTSAGRRRWLTAIRAANGRKRSQAERQACNTVCQVCCAAACSGCCASNRAANGRKRSQESAEHAALCAV